MKVFNLLKHPRAKYSILIHYFISESECKAASTHFSSK